LSLATLLVGLTPGYAGAKGIVRWVDAQGQVHYSDHAPTDQDSEVIGIHAAPGAQSATDPAKNTDKPPAKEKPACEGAACKKPDAGKPSGTSKAP
jgi:hypothetical protein